MLHHTPRYRDLNKLNSRLTLEASIPVSEFLAKWLRRRKFWMMFTIYAFFLNWTPYYDPILHPGIMIRTNLNLNVHEELQVSAFLTIWFKRKITYYIFFSIYSCQNSTSLWPYPTSGNHDLKKRNLKSTLPKDASTHTSAVLIRWILKILSNYSYIKFNYHCDPILPAGILIVTH